MKLQDFIRSDMESIVAEWERFARTLTPGAVSMDQLALRDHAKAMLVAIADDIETYQSERARGLKSRGEGSSALRATAATVHGGLRFTSQFSMAQLAAEFRALRATVLRLWFAAGGDAGQSGEPMVRFNEAIDQALAESIDAFMAKSDATRDLFLGVLGHDLRAPLATISSAAAALAHPAATPGQVVQLGGSVGRAAHHMAGMIENLIGYTRVQLGSAMPLSRARIDTAAVCRDALADAESTFSGGRIELQTHGDCSGEFDAIALRQLMTNLLVNALQHGERGGRVMATLDAMAGELKFSVANDGVQIPPESLSSLVLPMVRGGGADHRDLSRSSSGLGLFIAREIATAHGGTITIDSTPAGRTLLEVTLPLSGRARVDAAAVS
jgi:signal transduction histidine kinase